MEHHDSVLYSMVQLTVLKMELKICLIAAIVNRQRCWPDTDESPIHAYGRRTPTSRHYTLTAVADLAPSHDPPRRFNLILPRPTAEQPLL